MKQKVLHAIKNGSLSLQVYESLRSAIFTGQLRPGDPLREMHLARDLQVSQTTVREALVQLEQVGLVVRTPNVGTHVTKLSPQELAERVELRMLLEEVAANQAAPTMTEEHFTELGRRLDALGDAIARNAYFEEAQADLNFHRYIWERSGNRTLYRTLDQLAIPLFAFVSILRGASRQTLKDVVASHEGIVAALRRGDPETIREALRQHFRSGFSIPGGLS
jgi:DNA-binding GntR family transcriptional regulator